MVCQHLAFFLMVCQHLAFFLGHPVYIFNTNCLSQDQYISLRLEGTLGWAIDGGGGGGRQSLGMGGDPPRKILFIVATKLEKGII